MYNNNDGFCFANSFTCTIFSSIPSISDLATDGRTDGAVAGKDVAKVLGSPLSFKEVPNNLALPTAGETGLIARQPSRGL